MKQLMLATVASIALSLPAMAQSNNNTMQPDNETGAQHQYNDQSQSQTGNQQQAENQIDPNSLNQQQIRQIQSALDQKGFNVKHVDGKWGPNTEAALKSFQQKQNLQGSGQLDQQTLAALGVNANGQGQPGSATTGSGSNENGANQPAQNPGQLQNNSNMNGQSGGQGSNGQSSPQMDNQTNGNGAGNSSKQQ